MIEARDPKLVSQLFVFLLVGHGDERTNDQQESIRLRLQSNGKSAEQVIDALEGVQHAGVHYNRSAVDLILLPKLLRRRVVEHLRLDAGWHHVDFPGRDSVVNEPVFQFRRNRRDVIGKNGNKPIQSARDAVGEPCRPDKAITRQLIRHEINRVIEKRPARYPLGHDPNEGAFVVMRVNDIYPLLVG